MIKVEDGRDGGNPEFDGDVQDQYQDEVNAFRIIFMQIWSNSIRFNNIDMF